MSRPVILDLFCGGGGCTAGYVAAGFEVWGVDREPQPHYLASGASDFILADALRFLRLLIEGDYEATGGLHLDDLVAIHASPPCQQYSAMARAVDTKAPDLVGPVREMLLRAGKPYVIENVEGAPLEGCVVMLCGTMFGLKVRRHRLFEIGGASTPPLMLTPSCVCRHGVRSGRLIGHRAGGKVAPGRTKPPPATESMRRDAIGVPWMTGREARQAIPPRYTEFIGRRLIAALETT